jgi:hypothetical protein
VAGILDDKESGLRDPAPFTDSEVLELTEAVGILGLVPGFLTWETRQCLATVQRLLVARTFALLESSSVSSESPGLKEPPLPPPSRERSPSPASGDDADLLVERDDLEDTEPLSADDEEAVPPKPVKRLWSEFIGEAVLSDCTGTEAEYLARVTEAARNFYNKRPKGGPPD